MSDKPITSQTKVELSWQEFAGREQRLTSKRKVVLAGRVASASAKIEQRDGFYQWLARVSTLTERKELVMRQPQVLPVPTTKSEAMKAWFETDYVSTSDLKRELTDGKLWKYVPADEKRRLNGMNRIELRAAILSARKCLWRRVCSRLCAQSWRRASHSTRRVCMCAVCTARFWWTLCWRMW